MRIISGIHKGRRITAPKNLPVRPTTDFAKEGLFNILRNTYYFDELSVLDLYAGTGNISYEFASRGTQEIVAVDAHYGCTKFIQETAKKFDMPIHAIKSDVEKFLTKNRQSFDLVFADPPYNFDLKTLSNLIHLVVDGSSLKTTGAFILEHSKEIDFSEQEYLSDTRKYSNSVFSFFSKAEL